MFIDHTKQLQPVYLHTPVNTDGPFWRAITRYLDRRDRGALAEAVQRLRGEWVEPMPEPPQPVRHRKKGGWKNRR